jgi:hypothetical protein
MRKNNPFDHQSIGSKNARRAATAHARSLSSAAAHPLFPANENPPAAAAPPDHPPPAQRLLQTDSKQRKRYPLFSGLMAYFPDACAAVAEVSLIGNEQHNPGQPLHHARGKSTDHLDCILRHAAEAGGFDGKIRHSAALAWRALANLQEELENEMGFPLPRGARSAE